MTVFGILIHVMKGQESHKAIVSTGFPNWRQIKSEIDGQNECLSKQVGVLKLFGSAT